MKTAIGILLLSAVAAFTGEVNILTQSTAKPDRIGATLNPTPDQYRAAGWRQCEPLPVVADGWTRSPVMWVDSDGTNAIAYFVDVAPAATGYTRVTDVTWTNVGTPQVAGIYQDRLTADIEAEQAEDRLASFQPLIPQAQLLRTLLRRNFGDAAETNREVTVESVTAYFAGLTLAGTITAVQASDGVLLARCFEALVAWTGDGTIWTIPWEVVP